MPSLSKKGHRPRKIFGGEQVHCSNAKKNYRILLEGEMLSGLFVGEGERYNAVFETRARGPMHRLLESGRGPIHLLLARVRGPMHRPADGNMATTSRTVAWNIRRIKTRAQDPCHGFRESRKMA
jgi:hypothetical protein